MKVEVDVPFTPELLAKAFTEMDDESQAQFFIEVAKIASTWNEAPIHFQWYAVGRHLRRCGCSTEEARLLVRTIHEGIEAET